MTNPETQWREAYGAHTLSRNVDPMLQKAHEVGFRLGYLASSPKRPEVEEVAYRAIVQALFDFRSEEQQCQTTAERAECVRRYARKCVALIFGEPKTEEGEG